MCRSTLYGLRHVSKEGEEKKEKKNDKKSGEGDVETSFDLDAVPDLINGFADALSVHHHNAKMADPFGDDKQGHVDQKDEKKDSDEHPTDHPDEKKDADEKKDPAEKKDPDEKKDPAENETFLNYVPHSFLEGVQSVGSYSQGVISEKVYL